MHNGTLFRCKEKIIKKFSSKHMELEKFLRESSYTQKDKCYLFFLIRESSLQILRVVFLSWKTEEAMSV